MSLLFLPIEWRLSPFLIDYEDAVQTMEKQVEGIRQGNKPEQIWLLEHPALYTAGSSANPNDLLHPERFPVYKTGRGGQYTYHGPGQRVAYIMVNLKKRQKDVRKFVGALEEWLIQTLAIFHIQGQRRKGRVGIWVLDKGQEKKIAAIGIRLRDWISFHGIALNVNPELDHFKGIVPCGLPFYEVTSLQALGLKTTLEEVDHVLKEQWLKNSFLTTGV